ncbi:Crp/Fnr family transcriptional regulator [Sutcliffiella sp. NC1]|uniref:Crp/Fnr family transcriptional regulator n=1 Tax=Sutcliffiella sp. NC1 TaxID=3004096 RepID=UPI0022DE719E|nr:Crp/Fnr family transcriptional regulator [Sutcliffiella sp. NC1]WBL16058.1 Crp/Fnr family transcriptional regulator [Sutcliffiella sp. NC1]
MLTKNKSFYETYETLKELINLIDHTVKVEKECFLFQEGMSAKEIYIVRSGKILVSKVAADGKELTMRICGKDEIVGELTLFTDDARYILNAKAMEHCEVGVIKKDVLEEEFLHNNQLAFEFMKWMSDHFRRTQTKFRDLILIGKKGALYTTLIRMTNSYGVPSSNGILIDMHLTNQTLANFCGTTRESVNRMLSELKKNKIISIARGRITIHDLEYLKAEVNCEGCPIKYCTIE